MAERAHYRIEFEPLGKRVAAEAGMTLLDAARKAGIELTAVCSGTGTCGKCQVQVQNEFPSSPSLVDEEFLAADQLEAGWRLACQTRIQQSLKVFIPPESLTTPQRLQVESQADHFTEDFSFSVEDVVLDELSASSLFPERSTEFLEFLAASGGCVRLICKDGQLVNWVPSGQPIFGLAVDLGTTKIAAYLVDLISGNIAAKSSAMNPQISYGEDVISRILYCMEHENGRNLLQKLVVDTLNNLSKTMCAEVGTTQQQIIEIVVVGNTAMHHLFAGLPVRQLGLSPYSPAVVDAMVIDAAALGLSASTRARVFTPRNIAGYVGGDHVAMMAATRAWAADDTVIAIDIGTNTEISLTHKGHIYTCSCASGPAFEGAHIQEGMRAADGAIERIKIEGDRVLFQTISGKAPVGICGSGILDSVAELRRNEILNDRGNFDPSRLNVRGEGKRQEYVLVPAERSGVNRDIVITRRDVNEILLAKAAIQSGLKILLNTAEITPQQIDRIIIAGAFGTYLDLESVISIGMLPKLPLERFSQVGNAAGSGARHMLLSEVVRDQAAAFAHRAEYVELTLYPEFQKVYLNALRFCPFP